MTHPRSNPRSRYARRRGFTLVELMISIALVLILLLGVNFVFRTSVDAVTSGERLIGFTADARTAQAQIAGDFDHIATDPPCFVIASQIIPQFLNADDAKTGSDPTVYIDTSTNPPTWTPLIPSLYDSRFHRADMLRYFVHGLYKRRTGNNGSFISTATTSSDDAFVTLGHLMLPSRDGLVYVGPTSDAPTNLSGATNQLLGTGVVPGHLVQPNVPQGQDPLLYPTTYQQLVPIAQQRIGAYASDWVLGRSVVLLRDPSTITNAATPANSDVIYPRAPQPAWQAPFSSLSANQPWLQPPWYGVNLTPLGNDSVDNSGQLYTAPLPAPQPIPSTIQSSRYDLAGVTMEQFRRYVADAFLQERYVETNGVGAPGLKPYPLWWNPLVYSLGANSTGTYPSSLPYYVFSSWNASASTPAFYSNALVPDLARQEASPQINNPLDSNSVAQMAPYLLEHCSQFIVEYAGDYMQQNNTPGANFGAMTGIGADGQIDFVADKNGNKRIRWYGMPRSTSGVPNPNNTSKHALIRGYGSGDSPTGATMQEFVDVIPLRDYYWMFQNSQLPPPTSLINPPWEVDVDFDPTTDYGYQATSNSNGAIVNNHNFPPPASILPSPRYSVTKTPFTANGQFDARYAAVWFNDMPAMIRILIKVDDPNNKVKDGPWYEMVFRLK